VDENLELEVRKLIAERDITRLLYQYHDALNRARFNELADLFEHATYQTAYAETDKSHGVQTGEQVRENWERMVLLYNGLPRIQYVNTNVVVAVDESLVRASSKSYYLGLQALSDYYDDAVASADPFPLQVICGGRYEDVFEVIDGAWRFRSRRIFADLSGNLSRHLGIKPTEYQSAH
jgi:hypothetical protein